MPVSIKVTRKPKNNAQIQSPTKRIRTSGSLRLSYDSVGSLVPTKPLLLVLLVSAFITHALLVIPSTYVKAQTGGTVIDVSPNVKGPHAYTIKFATAEGQVTARETESADRSIGQKVAVYYNPGKPTDDIKVAHTWQGKLAYYLLGGFIGFVTLATTIRLLQKFRP